MKGKLLVTAALIFSVAAHAGCGKGPSKAVSQAGSSARLLYLRNCSACHGSSGEGNPQDALRGSSLTGERTLKQTDEQLFDWIQKGGNNMPSFRNSLTEEEIKSLVRLIREGLEARPSS